MMTQSGGVDHDDVMGHDSNLIQHDLYRMRLLRGAFGIAKSSTASASTATVGQEDNAMASIVLLVIGTATVGIAAFGYLVSLLVGR